MNRKIFITYGNSEYSQSLERIRKEAEESGEFDTIIVYTERDLPDVLKQNVLFQYSRGGGYWIWKPYICWKTLQLCDSTDVVFYSDAGNKIYKHKRWKHYWNLMKTNGGIFFYYKAYMEERSRKKMLEEYRPIIPKIRKMYQIQGCAFFISIRCRHVIKEWLDMMLCHPEWVIDAKEDEKDLEYPQFIENRHDQAVLSCAAYKYWKVCDLYITMQDAERYQRGGQPFFHARISNNMVRSGMVYEQYYVTILRKILINPVRYLKMWYYKLLIQQ